MTYVADMAEEKWQQRNVFQKDVPDGEGEEDNVEIYKSGNPRDFSFRIKNHKELGESLGILDFENAVKVAGSRNVILRKQGVDLENALERFMLDNAEEHGYELVSVPHIARKESFFGVGQLPKFEEDIYWVNRNHITHGLISTGEVPLVNMMSNTLLKEEQLPIRYAARTHCFRKEAGSAAKDTAGLIRLHEFRKVELVSFTDQESSAEEHEQITGTAEKVLARLGLPYRKVLLCKGDTGFSSSKTFDLEVWFPSQNKYREVSSCSNCTDFQSKRIQARYKDARTGKNLKVHTLNGSALAIGRTMAAVMENYQLEDGRILVPEVLRGWYMRNYIIG